MSLLPTKNTSLRAGSERPRSKPEALADGGHRDEAAEGLVVVVGEYQACGGSPPVTIRRAPRCRSPGFPRCTSRRYQPRGWRAGGLRVAEHAAILPMREGAAGVDQAHRAAPSAGSPAIVPVSADGGRGVGDGGLGPGWDRRHRGRRGPDGWRPTPGDRGHSSHATISNAANHSHGAARREEACATSMAPQAKLMLGLQHAVLASTAQSFAIRIHQTATGS